LLEGAQENTLDAAWFGKIPWISSLYAAALRACEMMATDMGETEYAAQCGQKLAQTRAAIELKLFNGEYFVQLPEAGHEHDLGVYQTSHIDQVQGQSWAWQIGLGRILDRDKTLSALRALYKYNFAPDVGPFKVQNPAGRPYALAGDGGLLMATNPQDLPEPFGKIGWQTSYFNECMSGFEHQAASHMIAEGLVLEGLAITRAIHDRYHASRRNPYNEIECSDHYARAMASYGSFITICGFEYHGPKAHLAFAPRITPDDFRAPFTAAEGWGTFSQQAEKGALHVKIALKHGHLRLSSLALTPPAGAMPKKATLHLGAKSLPATHTMNNGVLHIALAAHIEIAAGQTLSASLEP
ncbi:MAG: glycoside hydrolase family 116 protein, partial [Armatimonadota bacterium]|nr:glycoside hydrolase family 116 protein [Armatimonadota bacterium]